MRLAVISRNEGRFLQVRRCVAEQINDQIINKLSSLFGSAFLQWDIAGASAIQQQEYIFAVTFEHGGDDANDRNRKFRLLLVRKDVFASLTSGAEPGLDMTTPGMSRIRSLKWEFCRETGGVCKDGDCGCYGSERIQDLMTLRRMLHKHHLWREADCVVEKFNLEAWKRRGAQHGGPPVGTWEIKEGDVVRNVKLGWVSQVKRHANRRLFVQTTSNPRDELGYYLDKQQIDLERPLAANDMRLPKNANSLRKWEQEDRIPIVGTVMVAVPEATNRHALARTVSQFMRI